MKGVLVFFPECGLMFPDGLDERSEEVVGIEGRRGWFGVVVLFVLQVAEPLVRKESSEEPGPSYLALRVYQGVDCWSIHS